MWDSFLQVVGGFTLWVIAVLCIMQTVKFLDRAINHAQRWWDDR